MTLTFTIDNGSSQSVHSSMTSMNFFNGLSNGSSQSVHSSMDFPMDFFNGLSNGLLQWILSICTFFHDFNELFQWTLFMELQ